jgi:hypothetical protein
VSILTDKCPTCGRKKTRSLAQNSRYWDLLTLAAEKLGHSKEIWHEYFKQKFLPMTEIDIKGEVKLIPCSTSNLPMHGPEKPNWDDYTMKTECFLAMNDVYLCDDD